MHVTFLAQPFDAFGGWTASWLAGVLRHPGTTSLDVAVAWIKRSGLARLRNELVTFRQRGGKTSAILGIDEGGGTAQGLRLAAELFDRAHIYHEPGRRRTFHPKVYLASGSDSANLLIASSNLTAGGLFSNYETGLACELDLNQEEDRALVTQVRQWFAMLYSDKKICLPLTDDLMATVLNDPSYAVGDEDQPQRTDSRRREDYDGVNLSDSHELFGVSILPKAGFPPPLHISQRPSRKARTRPTASPKRKAAASKVKERWWKPMSPSDAQQPPGGETNVTGVLRLAKAGHDIDSQTYFRHQMFADAEWDTLQTSQGSRDTAYIPFEVVIDGANLGQVKLKVDHSQHREAQQHNIVTLIHWGRLGSALRQTDYTGAWVVLEALSGQRYRLTITRANQAPPR